MAFFTENDHELHRKAVQQKRDWLTRALPDEESILTAEETQLYGTRYETTLCGLVDNLVLALVRNYVSGDEPVSREFLPVADDDSTEFDLIRVFDYGRGYPTVIAHFNSILSKVDPSLVLTIKKRFYETDNDGPKQFAGLDLKLSLSDTALA